jgi:uncharacterized membrane protein YgdD (TMEM256/DUF423 family)
MYKNLTITSFIGVLTIILGAFGAHALKKSLTIEDLNSFETAIRYQMYHVIVLLFVNTYKGFSDKERKRISLLFFTGILLFSGSIYAIHLTEITAKSIWFVTPFGGLFFVTGWLLMGYSFSKKKSTIDS